MTCIVGIVDGTEVWLGGDRASANVDQWTQHPGATPKVLRLHLDNRTSALIGYTSSFRMADILWHCIREGGFSEAWERRDPVDHADIRMLVIGELSLSCNPDTPPPDSNGRPKTSAKAEPFCSVSAAGSSSSRTTMPSSNPLSDIRQSAAARRPRSAVSTPPDTCRWTP